MGPSWACYLGAVFCTRAFVALSWGHLWWQWWVMFEPSWSNLGATDRASEFLLITQGFPFSRVGCMSPCPPRPACYERPGAGILGVPGLGVGVCRGDGHPRPKEPPSSAKIVGQRACGHSPSSEREREREREREGCRHSSSKPSAQYIKQTIKQTISTQLISTTTTSEISPLCHNP